MKDSYLRKIEYLFSLQKESTESDFNNGISVTLSFPENKNISVYTSELNNLGISCDPIEDNKIEIELSKKNIGIKIFYNEGHFLKDFSKDDFNEDLAILNYNESFLLFSSTNNKSFNNNGELDRDFFIENTYYYIKTLEFISNINQFAEYTSNAYREIIIISPQKGKLIISYPNIKEKLPPFNRIKPNCEKLFDRINNTKGYPSFFKNELFDLLKNEERISRYPKFLLRLDVLLESADRSFEIYLNNFSFDDLKDKLKKDQETYFSKLRDILSKVFSQILAIPISISATVFASYKTDDFYIKVLIISAFTIYTIFSMYLLNMLNKDVREIENDFNEEEPIIIKKSKLPLVTIEKETNKVKRRIKEIHCTIKIFRYIVFILLILLSFYMFFKPDMNRDNTGFRGCAWGIPQKEIILNEDKKPAIVNSEILEYDNEKIAGLNCKIVYYFQKDSLYKGVFIFNPVHKNYIDTISDYYLLKNLLTSKYQKPITKIDTKNGNKEELISEIVNGNISLISTWISEDRLISLRIWSPKISHIELVLEYQYHKKLRLNLNSNKGNSIETDL
jgi:hypothetical protein